VAGFSWPQFRDNPLDTLVVPKPTRELFRGLCRRFGSGSGWGSDFVEGKGKGNIVLLHGPPGVGKSYSAGKCRTLRINDSRKAGALTCLECFAEEVRRPLISLTSSDLGTEPTAVEQKLSRWFDLAKVWNAVLLIDEADVFLEHRSDTDLIRNNLVAIFLRTLEYYAGILFLTTNRIRTFDQAIISRIDLSLYFPALSQDQRVQIWQILFRKSEDENTGIIRIHPELREYIRQGEDLLSLQWNGREIRSGA
jgi:SpoVK/Ycf46/Vps4 family AAA+-type ATPase